MQENDRQLLRGILAPRLLVGHPLLLLLAQRRLLLSEFWGPSLLFSLSFFLCFDFVLFSDLIGGKMSADQAFDYLGLTNKAGNTKNKN